MSTTPDVIHKEDIAELIKLDKIKSKLLTRAVMKVLNMEKINAIYRETGKSDGVAFIDSVLKGLQIQYECPKEDINNIPKEGPFILVANHPYGGVDGLILMSILLKVRPDFKMMVNYLLQQFPEIAEQTIGVDPFERNTHTGLNIRSVKKSLHLLNQGTPIGLFPAGEVSSFKANKLKVADKIWNPVVGKLIKKSEVRVVPVYFSGQNSLLFQLLGIVNPGLRTARLPAELFNKNQKITVRIGKPVSGQTLSAFEDIEQMLRFLRAKTYSLGSALDVKPYFLPKLSQDKLPETIISPVSTHLLAQEAQALIDKGQILAGHNDIKVLLGSAMEIPHILTEISRLREITFRAAGEGTGKSQDTDEFDVFYKHLFLWNTTTREVMGAYRLGEGNKLFNRLGKKGFYLNQLFRFSKDFAPVFKSSLELGRSFIIPAYQRKPMLLLLLWKGINEFVRRNNRFEYLIGPVSISNSFSGLSKDLMVDYIRKNHFDSDMAQHVRPRKKYHFVTKGESKQLLDTPIKDLKFMDQLIADIEPNQAKLPVLLKKYLMQNAKIIAFNVDPKFNNSLDGLLVLKLSDIPESTFDLIA